MPPVNPAPNGVKVSQRQVCAVATPHPIPVGNFHLIPVGLRCGHIRKLGFYFRLQAINALAIQLQPAGTQAQRFLVVALLKRTLCITGNIQELLVEAIKLI